MSARLHILQTERTNEMEWIRIAFSYGTLPASFMRHLPYTTFETEANDDCAADDEAEEEEVETRYFYKLIIHFMCTPPKQILDSSLVAVMMHLRVEATQNKTRRSTKYK